MIIIVCELLFFQLIPYFFNYCTLYFLIINKEIETISALCFIIYPFQQSLYLKFDELTYVQYHVNVEIHDHESWILKSINLQYKSRLSSYIFAFAILRLRFKTQNAPCVSRFKCVLFSDRFQFAF